MLRWLKRTVVRTINRDRANRIAGPFHDWRARRRSAQKLRALPEKDLCVNLGCGHHPLKGWINVDWTRVPEVDIVWDLRRGLPFSTHSCSAIFAEHVIEHLEKADAQELLRECHRVLQPGGVLRISTPDAERFVRSYVGDQQFLKNPAFEQPSDSPMDRINLMMREGGQHLWCYDFELLSLLLRRAGFETIIAQEFGSSAHPQMKGIDVETRAFESLYVEVIEPSS